VHTLAPKSAEAKEDNKFDKGTMNHDTTHMPILAKIMSRAQREGGLPDWRSLGAVQPPLKSSSIFIQLANLS